MPTIRPIGVIASIGVAFLLAAPMTGSGQTLEAERLTRGTWLAIRIKGVERSGVAQSTISFEPGGAVYGSSGCNRFRGTYRVEATKLMIGRLAVTKMFCVAPGIMDQEQKYLSALDETRAFSFNGTHLTFLDSDGAAVVRFTWLP